MPSFDIVSKVDLQTLDNAINSAKRELDTRYDLKGTNSTIELDKKAMHLQIVTSSEMHMDAIEKILIGRLVKNGLDPACMDFGKQEYASGNMMRKDIAILQGLDRDFAKKIVKTIKDLKLKVQPQIMDDQVRVTGKKINDLQEAIAACKAAKFERPLQYVNMK